MLAPDDPRHGTTNGYGNLKCRCDRCRAANTASHKRFLRGERSTGPAAVCSVSWCTRPVYAVGMCNACRRRALSGADPEANPNALPRVNGGPCRTSWCEKVAHSDGLCMACYQSRRRGTDPEKRLGGPYGHHAAVCRQTLAAAKSLDLLAETWRRVGAERGGYDEDACRIIADWMTTGADRLRSTLRSMGAS